MSAWKPDSPPPFPLPLNRNGELPIFRQIANALAQAILEGRLAPGKPLPGTRSLAERLKVSRNSVIGAYLELEAQGLVRSTVGQGTIVLSPQEVPEGVTPRGDRSRPSFGFDLPSRFLPMEAGEEKGGRRLDLRLERPDPALLPVEELARAYRRILKAPGARQLRASDPLGHGELREALAAWLLEQQGLTYTPEHLLITRGSRHGLDLLARAFLHPGDWVAVEDPGSRTAWESYQMQEAELLPLPVDSEGANPEDLEAHLRRGPVRLIHLTPGCQMPTGVTMSAARRQRFLEIAARHRIPILEESPAGGLHLDEQPPLAPLASQDPEGVVVHLGGFSGVLTPSLRLGFLAGPRSLMSRLARLRQATEEPAEGHMESALRDLMLDGTLSRHMRKARTAYRERRDAAITCLRELLGDRIRIDPPAQGLALWVRAGSNTSGATWAGKAEEQGVLVEAGRNYSMDLLDLPALRLAFGAIEEPQMTRALTLLAEAFPG